MRSQRRGHARAGPREQSDCPFEMICVRDDGGVGLLCAGCLTGEEQAAIEVDAPLTTRHGWAAEIAEASRTAHDSAHENSRGRFGRGGQGHGDR